MRAILFAATATVALAATVPASAQVYLGAGPGGAGVAVGPVEFGVGPGYGWNDHRNGHWRGDYGRGVYAYGGLCRLVREHIETPRGHVIFRTHRECD